MLSQDQMLLLEGWAFSSFEPRALSLGLWFQIYLKEYSVILTTSFYDMNQKI